MFSDPLAVAARVAHAFDAIGIPYWVGGSVATSIHGELRTTQDIDFVAQIHPGQVLPLVRALQGEFYIDAEMIRTALREHASFNIICFETSDKADIFLPKVDARFRTEMSRRWNVCPNPGNPEIGLCVASPEDAILHKLEWYQAGGGFSDRQWRDILGVLKTQGAALEFDYMREWADTLGIRDLLDRALDEAGSPDRT